MPRQPSLFRKPDLAGYKANRLLNINLNIVLADFLSTAATALIMGAIQTRLPTALAMVTVTALVDGAISLGAFVGLHLYANRVHGIKDLLRVQCHRWALCPLHYLVGAGLQFTLLAAGVDAGIGVFVSYMTAIGVTRTVHTMYGKKSGLF